MTVKLRNLDSGDQEKKMRCLLLHILIILLLIDLADDGFPGKVRFGASFLPSDSTVFSPQYYLEQVDYFCKLPIIKSIEISNHYQIQSIIIISLHNHSKSTPYYANISGGIPL